MNIKIRSHPITWGDVNAIFILQKTTDDLARLDAITQLLVGRTYLKRQEIDALAIEQVPLLVTEIISVLNELTSPADFELASVFAEVRSILKIKQPFRSRLSQLQLQILSFDLSKFTTITALARDLCKLRPSISRSLKLLKEKQLIRETAGRLELTNMGKEAISKKEK